MAGADRAAIRTGWTPPRVDPVWLLDVATAAGAGALVWAALGAPGAPVWADLAREIGPLAIAAGLAGRLTVAAVTGRLRRGATRADLYRRLVALDGALEELRRSITRESALEYLERADAFSTALTAGRGRLSGQERKLARGCAEIAAALAGRVRETLADRHGVEALADRIRRDVLRAERFGDFDQGDARGLLDAVDDAVGLLDEAVLPGENVDHFGRLEADRRAFHRRLEWLSGSVAERVEERGANLFETLRTQLTVKVELAESGVRWRTRARMLEARLSSAAAPSVVEPDRQVRRPVERFDPVERMVPPRPTAQIIRLPAAND
jgi:hypothetical protein